MAKARPLTLRDLNRATLARQMLLAREAAPAVETVERLGGMQAQLARPPFIGLWTRLRGFDRDELLRAVTDRTVVRGTLWRGTLHLVTARDYLAFRPVLRAMLAGGLQRILGDRLKSLDAEGLVATARAILDERPRPFDEIRPLLAAAGHPGDERALGYAVRMLLPLLQLPSGGTWGWDAKAPFGVAETWIGAPLERSEAPHELVRRYLAAFGPATPADASAWSGVRGLKAAFEELRPELVSFRDERGRELFDVPDAPRPPGDADAPVRYLPEYDNLVLAHADRARVLADEHKRRLISPNLQVAPAFLVDGQVAGTWKMERARGAAVLAVQPFAQLPKGARPALVEEGDALLRWVEPDARDHQVTVLKPA